VTATAQLPPPRQPRPPPRQRLRATETGLPLVGPATARSPPPVKLYLTQADQSVHI
jgi:hypothetical protein